MSKDVKKNRDYFMLELTECEKLGPKLVVIFNIATQES